VVLVGLKDTIKQAGIVAVMSAALMGSPMQGKGYDHNDSAFLKAKGFGASTVAEISAAVEKSANPVLLEQVARNEFRDRFMEADDVFIGKYLSVEVWPSDDLAQGALTKYSFTDVNLVKIRKHVLPDLTSLKEHLGITIRELAVKDKEAAQKIENMPSFSLPVTYPLIIPGIVIDKKIYESYSVDERKELLSNLKKTTIKLDLADFNLELDKEFVVFVNYGSQKQFRFLPNERYIYPATLENKNLVEQMRKENYKK